MGEHGTWGLMETPAATDLGAHSGCGAEAVYGAVNGARPAAGSRRALEAMAEWTIRPCVLWRKRGVGAASGRFPLFRSGDRRGRHLQTAQPRHPGRSDGRVGGGCAAKVTLACCLPPPLRTVYAACPLAYIYA